MGQWTPGPWDSETRFPAGVRWDAIVRGGPKRDPICSVFSAGYKANEAFANAALIASAPALYEATLLLAAFIESAMASNGIAGTDCQITADGSYKLSDARAALAAARGDA